MKIFSLPDEPALVIASDVHVRTEHDARYLLLCQLVEEALAKRARGLVLNGDIFDFFFGWGPYFQSKYVRLLSGLDALARSGAKVWFVEGNHEFGMDPVRRKYKFEVISSKGKLWLSPNGSKYLIAHGDLLRRDFKYELFRAFIRSWLISALAICIPQWFLDQFTLWFASTSRKKDKYRVLRHEKIISCAKQEMLRHDADVIIIGHFHHPYDEVFSDGKRLLSVSSWDEPSCLVVLRNDDILRVMPQ